MAWQRFRVELAGHPDPIDVQTSARDWASITVDPDSPRVMEMTFQVVHAALLRTGIDVPRDFDAFLDVLDGVPDDLGATVDELDPTHATP